MSLVGVRVVAFDLDGTLCYYAVTIEEAIAESLRRLDLPSDLVGDLERAAIRYNELWDEEEKRRDPAGIVRRRVWEHLLREHGVNNPRLASDLAEEYAGIRMPSIRLFEGAGELLRDLKGTYRLGLLTNGPADMQWPKIETLGIAPLFDAIVVSGDVGICKPDRRIFELLLSHLGAAAAEVLYVGDSPSMDVVGAKCAGMRVAWVSKNGKERPAEAVPDIAVERVAELREVLL
jgi:HAD superfamily hydrolase (TIGR01549 family)